MRLRLPFAEFWRRLFAGPHRTLNEVNFRALGKGRCPDCDSRGEIYSGPEGAGSVNVLCGVCGSRFNMTPLGTAERTMKDMASLGEIRAISASPTHPTLYQLGERLFCLAYAPPELRTEVRQWCAEHGARRYVEFDASYHLSCGAHVEFDRLADAVHFKLRFW